MRFWGLVFAAAFIGMVVFGGLIAWAGAGRLRDLRQAKTRGDKVSGAVIGVLAVAGGVALAAWGGRLLVRWVARWVEAANA